MKMQGNSERKKKKKKKRSDLAIPLRHPLFLWLSHDQLLFCNFPKPSLFLCYLITYKASQMLTALLCFRENTLVFLSMR